MSRHHVKAKWSTLSPRFRKLIEPTLPRPCVNNCGQQVHREQEWHVAHIPGRAMRSGQPTTLRDVGPAHAHCNLSDGGRAGAAITNAKRRRARQIERDIRPW